MSFVLRNYQKYINYICRQGFASQAQRMVSLSIIIEYKLQLSYWLYSYVVPLQFAAGS